MTDKSVSKNKVFDLMLDILLPISVAVFAFSAFWMYRESNQDQREKITWEGEQRAALANIDFAIVSDTGITYKGTRELGFNDVPLQLSQKPFVIVAGSFTDPANAQRRLEHLQKIGYGDSEINHIRSDDLHTVCALFTNQQDLAMKHANLLRDNFEIDTYIFKKL